MAGKAAGKVSPSFPPWLHRTDPEKVDSRTLHTRKPEKDPHLRKPSPKIDLKAVSEDKDYVYIKGGVLYEGNHATSFYVDQGKPMAWCQHKKCIKFDAYNKTYLANKELPIGSVLEVINLKESSKKITAAVTDRGPYLKKKHIQKGAEARDFDVSKKGMMELSGELRDGLAVPIEIKIYAVPKVFLEKCGEEGFECAGALAQFKSAYDLLNGIAKK